ncbi:MAG: hypothetical protein IC227_00280 [Enterococcus lacertideformus]|uniref:Uncharacterized protein n=1 Tax=Enterococcus lacertideformus TaxID=2771493 RepID=A0A931ASP7_9ENTE|nr:hypothetical protein [Enterococcus lacertideformus]
MIIFTRLKNFFADEPTTSLNKNKEIVIQTLQEMTAQDKTILVVTHGLALTDRLGDVLDIGALKQREEKLLVAKE